MMAHTQKSLQLTGRHVILGFVSFFVVVIAVEAIFITLALSTHTGVVSKQPYRKGLHYNERIAFARTQEKLGWRETLTVSKNKRTLTLALKDQYGKPVLGLKLSGKIGRPVTMTQDRILAFSSAGKGSYSARMPEKMAGAYIADLKASDATHEGKILWRFRKRLWLKP